jgi:hypothetical protein
MERVMRTQVLFVAYKVFIIDGKEVLEDVIDFSLEREVAEKIAEISGENGFPAKVEKELACCEDNSSEMFVIKNNKPLELSKAKELKDFKDHVINNMTGFEKRVLLASRSLTI